MSQVPFPVVMKSVLSHNDFCNPAAIGKSNQAENVSVVGLVCGEIYELT